MILFKSTTVLLLLVILAHTQYPTTTCPQLCAQNCTSTGSCSICYQSFLADAANTTCNCPSHTYQDPNGFCQLCPVLCDTCPNQDRCTSCIEGYQLSNSYSCIPKITNDNGWASIPVTEHINRYDDMLHSGAENLVIINGSLATNVTLSNRQTYQSDCTNLPHTWFGGYQIFTYTTKLLYTVFSLPPHQWINIRFHAVMIDNWQNNTLQVELSSSQSYNPNSIADPVIVWAAQFDSSIRNYDLCGDTSFGDNLVLVNIYAKHSDSSAQVLIRLNESETIITSALGSSNLEQLSFGVNQFLVRVGTCGRNCKDCSGPLQCNECYQPYSAVNGECVCDASLGIGFPTYTGCAFNCNDREYYQADLKTCVRCSEKYEYCQSCDASKCQVCKLGYFYYSDDYGNVECRSLCPPNYSQARGVEFVVNGLTSERDQCVPCPANCLTCNLDICIFCKPGYQYHQGSCLSTCPLGFFSRLSTCASCSIFGQCSNCTSQGCLDCQQGLTVRNQICWPPCFVNDTSVVGSDCNFTCVSPCSSCYGPGTNQCLSCISPQKLYRGECFSACPAGTYQEAGECKRCDRGCQTCSNSTACLTCLPGYFFTYLSCRRLCPESTFPSLFNVTYISPLTYNTTSFASITNETSFSSPTCLPCSQGCTRCLDALTCFSCRRQLFLFNFSCLSTQVRGYEWEDGEFRRCGENCAKCRHKICRQCDDGWFLEQGQCVQECPAGKYKRQVRRSDDQDNSFSVMICAWKSPLCKEYSANFSDDSCLHCSYTYPATALVSLTINQMQRDVCSFACPDFYTKTDSLTCVPCPENCRRCTPEMVCLKCLDNYVINAPESITALNVMNETCLRHVCGDGQFSDSLQCQPCPHGCKICLLDGSCYVCQTGFTIEPYSKTCRSDHCSQLNQYQITSGAITTCDTCSPACLSCSDSKDACTSCPLFPANQTYLFNSICTTECPSGFFPHRASRTCRRCDPRCSACTEIRHCLACSHDFYLLDFYDPRHASCVPQCPVGFWVNDTTCQRCYKDCKKCYGPSEYQCLECYPNFFIEDGKCVYQCAAMRYRDRGSGHCEWCHSSCQECQGPTEQGCISCQNNYYYYDHRCFANECPGATYLSIPEKRLCEPCQYGCQYCSSSQFCHFCTPGFKFYKGWCYTKCPGSLKSKWERYYLQLLGQICGPCEQSYSDRCQRCDLYSCKKCQEDYYLYTLSTQQVTEDGQQVIEQCFHSCPSGTFAVEQGSRRCVPCAHRCLTCTAYHQCTQCQSGYQLINGYCGYNCPAGRYQNAASCYSCPTNCKSCTNITFCTSCQPGYSLFYSPTLSTMACLAPCPATYYNHPANWCLKCPSRCLTCTNASYCIQCSNGASPVNGICYGSSTDPCISQCLVCTSGVCERCQVPLALYRNQSTGVSSCVSTCPLGFYLSGFGCDRCNATCASCNNTMNNCTSCVAGLYRMGQQCLAVCPVGTTADSSSGTCKSCPSNCYNCDSSECYLCSSGYYLHDSECHSTCPTSTFLSPTTQMCFQCPEHCLGCTDIQNCTRCSSGYYLFNNTCLDDCPTTSYLHQTESTGVCQTCAAPCYTCSSASQCSSCIEGYVLNGTQCQEECGDGYYLNILTVSYNDEVEGQNFTMYGQCEPCSVNCQTCINQSNYCSSCPTGLQLVSGTCLENCPPSTVAQGAACVSCPPLCLQCSSTSTCEVCVSSAALYQGRCLSTCPVGYFRALVSNIAISSATYLCTPCSTTCSSCSGQSQYNCLSCIPGYYYSEGMCLSTCPTGTFANNATSTCSPCPVTCTKCSSLINCQECVENYTLTNTYQCHTPTPPACTVQYCITCASDSSTSCSQCANGFRKWNGNCLSACPQGTYDSQGTCLNCDFNCSSCGLDGCRSCINGTYLYQGYCYVVCPNGTKSQGSGCVTDPCEQYNTDGGCLSCSSPYLLHAASATCVLSCPAGTVRSSGQCLNCSFNCLSCVSSSSCTSCKAGTYLYLGKCYFMCPIGTFAEEGRCKDCSMSYCQQCSNSSTCTVCQPGSGAFLIGGNCLLDCPSGTYMSQEVSECVSCAEGCQQCLNSSLCQACTTPLYLYQGQCLSTCPTVTYPSAGTCHPCPSTCYTCSSSTSCTSCLPGYSLSTQNSQTICLFNCPSGTFTAIIPSSQFNNSYIQQCTPCFAPCRTCYQSGDRCTSCLEGYSLQGSYCSSQCDSGRYPAIVWSTSIWGWSFQITVCLRCPDRCPTCSDSNTCTSCWSGYTLDGNGNCISNCTNINQYFNSVTRQCLNCSSTCYTCYGPLVSNCLSCYPDYYLTEGSCLSTCPFGYYTTSTFSCQPCNANCADCEGAATNCTVCPSGGYLQLVNGLSSCTADCLTGYYRDEESETCGVCHESCLNCSGSSETQCTVCPEDAFLSQGKCMTECPSGTAPVIANGLNCITCPTGCLVCTNTSSTAVSCTECQSSLFLDQGQCKEACPVGTYPSLETYSCQVCSIDGCYRCIYNSSMQVQCLACQPGYFMLGDTGTCVTTCPSGYILTSSGCEVDHTCRLFIYNDLCLESCPERTYPLSTTDSANLTVTTCTACSSNCVRCSSATACQQCEDSHFKVTIASVTTCVSVCPSGYYNSSGDCLPCSAPCIKCYQTASMVTCTGCASGYYQLNGQCLTACPDGFYSSATTCLPCASQCASCDVSASNCTACKTSTYLTPTCVSQTCSSSQYQDISGNCQNCHSTCSACYGGNSYECTACSASYYFLGGQCLTACPEGYIISGAACVLCPSHCQTCNTSSLCVVCLPGYLLTNGNCITSCQELNTDQVTYYTTASTCLQCNATVTDCLVCTRTISDSIVCQQCQDGKYLHEGACQDNCPSGFYSTSASTCASCSPNCTTCSSASVCTECLAGTVLSNGQCTLVCPSGSYLLTTSGVSSCTPCSAHCLACTSSGCSSCVQPYALFGTTCGGCIDEYYWSTYVGICVKCSTECKTCAVTSANCTSCAVGYYQYSASCVANCPSGYYTSVSGVCMACSTSNCSSCPDDSCLSCLTGTVKVVTNGVLTCETACPSATFLVASTSTCVTCSSNCQNCTSATACTLCASGYLYSGYCFSTCPTGYTPVAGVCVACPVGCKSCYSLTNCSSCDSGLVLDVNGSCVINTTANCSTGYFQNSLGTCTQCYPTCQTCIGALSYNCLTCFDGATLRAGVCVQDCNPGYYYNNSTMTCNLCTSIFPYCASCTSSACTVCSTNYTLSSGSCTQTCPPGTYLSNQQCYSCSSFCLSCTSATSCTSCMTGLTPAVFLYNGGCYSQCPNQTYHDGVTCAPCFQTCLTCEGAATNCTSCLTPYNLYGSSCEATCPNGTYSSNYICFNCSQNCLLCSGADSCTQCIADFYLIEGVCRSSCVGGYYVDTVSSRCLPCVAPCEECTSRTICTTCIATYILSGSNCISNCSVGAYYNTSLSGCVNCTLTNCGVCNENTCLSCAPGYYSQYNADRIVACVDDCYGLTATYEDSTTMNCSACYSYCERCVNATYCQLCDSSHYLLSAATAVNQCLGECPLGYFQTLIRTCARCGANCNECQNTTYCDVCQSNYYRYTSENIATATNVSCVSPCPSGYGSPTIINGLGLCFLCPSRCLVCSDTVTCTQCFYSSDILVDGVCTPSNCLNCLTCDNATNTCTKCVVGYVLYQGSCTAFCPEGMYANHTTGNCEKCMDNCVACFLSDTCAECINGYIFVNSTSSCENEGYINFGALGNMSGFTSNVTEIMATVYVSTSAGPIAFGALSSTYGVMQVCQFMYLMQGSTDGNEELNTFLDSLSIVSYTQSADSENSSSTTNSSSSSRRRLTATEYTSSFLSTNLPIFLIMIGFVCSYLLVLLFTKYNQSCCTSCPNLQRYVGYVCQFMQKRFKYIYVDLVMWISYLPFLYFAMLQIKELKFDSGINAISSLIAFVIIVIYPLYPVFILRKLFDKSDNPEEHLKNYKAICLLLPLDPEEVANRPLCADFQCCPKDNPDIAMVQMSLSPYIDKVVRPVYNQDVPEYAEFKYCTLAHWRLAYAAIKYLRKFLFVLLVVACPVPATTLGLLVGLSVVYMVYLIVLKPKEKLYLILQLILQSLILFFQIFMLIYVTTGGATVTALSIVAHGIGFALANSTLAIAIILNIMAYYTIFCCIYDLVKHMKAKVQEQDLNKIKQQIQIDEKDGFKLHDGDYDDYPEDAVHRDLEKDLIKKYGGDIDKELGIKKRKKGDDEATEENDEDYVGGHYDLDEKEFNLHGEGGSNSYHPEDGEQLPNLRQTHGPSNKRLPEDVPIIGDDLDKELGVVRAANKKGDDEFTQQNDEDWQNDPMMLDQKEFNVRSSMISKKKKKESKPEQGQDLPNLDNSRRRSRKRESKKAIPQYDDNTEDDMIKSKLSSESNPDAINEGLLKEREKDRFRREVGGDNIHVGKGNVREPTDKFRRGRDHQISHPAQQESMDYLFVSPNNKAKEHREETVQEVGTNDRIKKSQSKETPEGKAVMRQPGFKQKGTKESELEDISMKERKRKQAADPFGQFQEILEKEKEPTSIVTKEREKIPKKDIGGNNLLFVDDEPEYKERQPQPKSKKEENKFYKGSDDEADIGEVTMKERKGHRFKRGTKHLQQPEEHDIGAVGYDINTKKAEKKVSVKEFAEDDPEELTYVERQGQVPQKKQGFFGQADNDLEQVKGVERDKRKANKNRPSVFEQLEENMAESITIAPEGRGKKPRVPLDDDFQEIDMSKQVRGRPDERQRGKDKGLKLGENLEQSYDDVVKRNKEEVFKPKGLDKNSGLLDIEDDFEESSYDVRPASRMEKGGEKNKDTGLLGSYRGDQIGGEGINDVRKRRNSNSQKLRKKSGHLDVVKGNFDDGDEMGVGQDSRRVSKMISKKKIKSGVLNIEDNSDAQDIQELHFDK